MTRLRLDIEWRLTLFTLVLLPLLVSLGFWQLERAGEKVALAAAQTARMTQPPAPMGDVVAEERRATLAYVPVALEGHFHPRLTILKDNQLREGRYGVDVLTPFFDRGAGQWVLLNRGWVPADPARRSLPAPDTPEAQLRLQASVYVPPGEPYTLAPEQLENISWPLLVQDAADPALRRVLERELDAALFPLELRLAPDEPAGFRRDWPLLNSSPAKHRGYAVQWFTMAAALAVLFVLRSSNLVAVLRGQREEAQ